MVIATIGTGFEPRRVEPGIGFGDRKASLFAAGDQWRQKPALLLVIAKNDHRVQSENVHVDRRGAAEPRPAFGNRLHQHRSFGNAETAAAIFGRHCDAEPPGLGHRPVELVGKAALGVFGEPIIIPEPLAQPQHHRADFALLLGQCETHFHLRTFADLFV